MSVLRSQDAMEFFKHREGEWESRRVTHHLAFRRAESGESIIKMQCLEGDDPRIVALCKDHKIEPDAAQGGCYVTWRATMAWDQEGENHEGSTVFALVPDEDDVRKGRILRDRGYAEIVPIAGTYYLDDNDDFCLNTPYDGGAVEERFAFDTPDIVNRTSTVRRFGGISNATFSTERRVGSAPPPEVSDIDEILQYGLAFGHIEDDNTTKSVGERTFLGASRARFANAIENRASAGRPSVNSAFSDGFSTSTRPTSTRPTPNSAFDSGFSSSASAASGEKAEQPGANEVDAAAAKAGIDLSKVPPSMRAEFEASLEKDAKKNSAQ